VPVLFFVLAVVAGGVPLAPKAWASLRAGRADMNLLVSLSLGGACALGEWTEAASLAFLFSLAGRMETWSLERARASIAGLIEVAPAEARVLHHGARHGEHGPGEHEHMVEAGTLQTGMLVRVRPGERIPADGVVERGSAWVNQALLTGESVAVEKSAGDAVLGGSLNENGVLDVRVERAGADSTLERMARMVRESQARRAPSEQFIERFARYYTPAVLAFAILLAVVPPLAGGEWGRWIYQGMVVLLISCPCAFVISTPVTIVSAIASAAREGVLVKGGAFLEETAQARVAALALHGVLTTGQPVLREVVALEGTPREEIVRQVARLEISSGHGLAQAVVAAAGPGVQPIEGFRVIDGLGVAAGEPGEEWWAGNRRLLKEYVPDASAAAGRMEEMAGQGRTVIAFGKGPRVLALLSFEEGLRPGTAETVGGLESRGFRRIAVLTGGQAAEARAAAGAAGIGEVHAELTPEEKAEVVSSRLGDWRRVLMVGDGAGDSAALSAAGVGVRLGWPGADASSEAADIVVLGSDPRRLLFLVDHARRALRVVRQNVSVALIAKVLFLAAAANGKATLWMAVAADMGATMAVTLNGLRLLARRRHPRE
jgi:Cd2+/Zn2+-exporting ATPase